MQYMRKHTAREPQAFFLHNSLMFLIRAMKSSEIRKVKKHSILSLN